MADVGELFKEYARTGDESVRNAIVEQTLDLAHQVARRFASRGEPLEDLEQVAATALLKAVERFDPEHGAAFTAFAVPTITGELKRHFRDRGWSARVPRRAQELYLNVRAAVPRLSQDLGRPPTVAELAAEVGSSEEEVLWVREVAPTVYQSMSLDAPVSDQESASTGSTLGEKDVGLERVEDRMAVRGLLNSLPERDRLIIYLRFFEERTQSEIAERVGISQVHVSRLIRRCLRDLRRQAGSMGVAGPDDDDEAGADDIGIEGREES